MVGELLLYACLKDSDAWFVFWLNDEDTLGVTDGKGKLFEKQTTLDESKQLAGNVLESVVSDKWAYVFFTSYHNLLDISGNYLILVLSI